MSERTPLIQTVVVTRREPRYPHSTLRRFCTILLGCLVVLVVIALIIPFSLIAHRRWHNHDHFHHDPHFHHWVKPLAASSSSQGLMYDELQSILLNTPDANKIRSWNEYYSSGPDLAGKNLSQALWTRERWEEWGVKTDIIAYDVYLNYPVDHRLALLENGAVKYEVNLEEDILDEDPTTGLQDRVPTFHGYSANGNVTAPYVYVNFGTHWDFDELLKANVILKGKIAIAKYGRNFRGLKTQRAQELGMVGIVMYDDPQEDGQMTEENGYKPYPEGPARNPSAVQRGSTQFLSTLPGDPTTPGYPSKPGVPRSDTKNFIPSIPSIPISYKEAIYLLKHLNGHGPNASSFSDAWQGGGLYYKGVEYNIGPSPDSSTLNLFNEQEYVTTPIWNVIGIINGTIPDEVIVIGNHRDAWIAGGAGDPHSGTAALLEVVRSFGEALSAGWKPLRTIVFASWDGEEYALLGSTEWVEEYIPWLSSSVVAYLNVDVGARGDKFQASSAPLLNSLLLNVTSLVDSPTGNGSVRDNWDGVITSLGSGSDYCAFLDFAGVPSMDFWYHRHDTDPVYPYHSNYDSFHWMDKFGDPTWQQHTAIAKIWAVMTAKLSESPVLPLNATDYAISLRQYLDSIKAKAKKGLKSKSFSFATLDDATARLYDAAITFDAHAADLSLQVAHKVPWWQWWRKVKLYYEIRQVNTKYKQIERSFLHAEGLDGRSWFKHIVFAPGRWTGYAGETYPGLSESFEDGNLTNAVKWSKIIEESLSNAASLLE